MSTQDVESVALLLVCTIELIAALRQARAERDEWAYNYRKERTAHADSLKMFEIQRDEYAHRAVNAEEVTASLVGQLEAAKTLLGRIEFVNQLDIAPDGDTCVVCGAYRRDGHTIFCDLAAMLGRDRAQDAT